MTSTMGTATNAADTLAHRARHARAWGFQVGVLLAILAFGVLTYLARVTPYFPIDLTLTRALQGAVSPGLETFFEAVGWIGFPPQSNVIFGLVIVGIFLAGRRFEALMTLFAAVGSIGLWYALAPLIDRPRPSPELVNVAREIGHGSFPSGHAVNLTAIFGFLLYLVFVMAPPAWWRWALMALLAVPILTIGVARVHAGAHWPSDVLGGYLLGAIWLSITIQLYRRGRQWLDRRSEHHPEQVAHAAARVGGSA